MGIGIMDWDRGLRLGFGIEIGDWGLGLEIWIGDWDWGLRLGIVD